MSLKVDGVDVSFRCPIQIKFSVCFKVPNNKRLEYRDWETPYLRRIQKRYGKPGDKITFYGRIFTKEYGNMNWRDNEGIVSLDFIEIYSGYYVRRDPEQKGDEHHRRGVGGQGVRAD